MPDKLLTNLILCLFAVTALPNWAAEPGLKLSVNQSEVLRVEPILVSVKAQDSRIVSLPASPGEQLRFDIEPAVKPRPNARPIRLTQDADLLFYCSSFASHLSDSFF